MKVAAAAALLALTVSALPARANDSNMALAAGGVVPLQSTTIHLAYENLVIEPWKIMVQYRFKNLTDRPQHVVIAFPFAREFVGGDVAQTIPWDRPADIFKFNVKVRGQDITPRYETHWFDTAGKEIPSPDGKDPHVKDERVQYQAVWEQDYAPHEEVAVEHEYVPISGSSLEPPDPKRLRHDFCMKDPPKDLVNYTSSNIRYILKTARTWAGPIDDFTLNIVPGASLSHRLILPALCGFPLKVRKSYEFYFHATHFTPVRDVNLLLIVPIAH